MATYLIVMATCPKCDVLMQPITKLKCPSCKREVRMARLIEATDTAAVEIPGLLASLRQRLRAANRERAEAVQDAYNRGYMEGAEAALRHFTGAQQPAEDTKRRTVYRRG